MAAVVAAACHVFFTSAFARLFSWFSTSSHLFLTKLKNPLIAKIGAHYANFNSSSCETVHFSQRSKLLRKDQWPVAQTCSLALHGHRAGTLGRTCGPGVADLCAGMAGASCWGSPGPFLSMAGALGGAALQLRLDHAGWNLGASQRIHRDLTQMVDSCAGHSVLASLRTSAADRTSLLSPQFVWISNSNQHRATYHPASRASSLL